MAGINQPRKKKQWFRQYSGPWEQRNEIEMYDNAIAEYMAIYGLPIDYFPVEANPNRDRIFGEDAAKRYLRKHELTALVKDGGFEENLIYGGFGELNQVEFQIYIHIPTFRKMINRDPLPSDQFYLPHSSTIAYEVIHVDWMTLGLEGNVFGYKSVYLLTCKHREVSHDALNNVGSQFGVVDGEGDLMANAPADSFVDDGSGRVRNKYQVRKPVLPVGGAEAYGDNDFVRDVVEGEVDDVSGERDGGFIIQRDRTHWGEW